MENSDSNSGFKLVATPSGNSFTGVQSSAKPIVFHYFTKKRLSLTDYNSGSKLSINNFKTTIWVKIFHRISCNGQKLILSKIQDGRQYDDDDDDEDVYSV